METLTIVFVDDASVDYGQGVIHYKTGETHELRADKAKRWVKRNKAKVISLPPVIDAVETTAEPDKETVFVAPVTAEKLEEVLTAIQPEDRVSLDRSPRRGRPPRAT